MLYMHLTSKFSYTVSQIPISIDTSYAKVLFVFLILSPLSFHYMLKLINQLPDVWIFFSMMVSFALVGLYLVMIEEYSQTCPKNHSQRRNEGLNRDRA